MTERKKTPATHGRRKADDEHAAAVQQDAAPPAALEPMERETYVPIAVPLTPGAKYMVAVEVDGLDAHQAHKRMVHCKETLEKVIGPGSVVVTGAYDGVPMMQLYKLKDAPLPVADDSLTKLKSQLYDNVCTLLMSRGWSAVSDDGAWWKHKKNPTAKFSMFVALGTLLTPEVP